MLKISRLTDYGLLASVYLARHPGRVTAAREIAGFYRLSADHGMGVIRLPRAVEFGDEFRGASRSSTASMLAFALRGIGIGGNLDLVPEGAFRFGRGLLLLRLPDLAIASFLALSHVRTSFR